MRRDVERIVALPGMLHKETQITAELREPMSLLDVGSRLHPTPAVCGWPTEAARRWLERNEGERGYFAGPLGWRDASGGGVLAVALRASLVRPDRAIAWAGAGVVSASDPEAEWAETELKLRTVAKALRAGEVSQ